MVAPYPGGAGVASKISSYGIEKFATTLTNGSAGTEARSATQDGNYRHGDVAAEPASGTPVTTLRTRPGPICRCPELNETFLFMLPGWTAEKVMS